jgi:hypothetical protein
MLATVVLAAASLLAQPLPHPIRGDFDHDGKPDVAKVVPAARGRYQLVVVRGARGHPVSVVETFDDIGSLYLVKARPGRWKTWCGKGGGNENDPCPRTWVTLRGDTLDFGVEEATESVAIWNGKRFEVVLLSD